MDVKSKGCTPLLVADTTNKSNLPGEIVPAGAAKNVNLGGSRMKKERIYERLRMEILQIEEDDIVTSSPPFDGGEDSGTTLPPIFD